MKKLVYYFIFLLALLMMLLCSSACRSPKTMTCSSATTDSVNLRIMDTTNQSFSFTFDSLVLWADLRNDGSTDLRTIQAQPLPKFLSSSISKFHHAVIYGGHLTANITRAIVHDSIRNKSSTQVQHSVIPCYRNTVIPKLIPYAIALALLFLFLKLRNKVLSR